MKDGVRYHWRLLSAGPLKLDGGGMFGVIPRVMWSKMIAPDAENRITLGHNCLLLNDPKNDEFILIEAGSGDKFDAKMRAIYGLGEWTIRHAVEEADVSCDRITHAIMTHLHFDHIGGLTRRVDGEIRLTFANAMVYVQRREWEDANKSRSVMTRTYLRENLEPLQDRIRLVDSASPFERGTVLDREATPAQPLERRVTRIFAGIDVFLVPGHTWGQQAVRFTDTDGRLVVFTPDVMPTQHHVGSAYNLAYDVEPYMSTISRQWFLREAIANNWLMVLCHEAEKPCQRARVGADGTIGLVAEDGGTS